MVIIMTYGDYDLISICIAIEKGLVDELKTSDEYVREKFKSHECIEIVPVTKTVKPNVFGKLMDDASEAMVCMYVCIVCMYSIVTLCHYKATDTIIYQPLLSFSALFCFCSLYLSLSLSLVATSFLS